nr:hypothetical protein [Tanacetum cinerariifolium]
SSIEMKFSKKSVDGENNQFENSNNGYLKKMDSDVSVEELLRNGKSIGVFDDGRELTYEEKLEVRRNLFREFGYRDSLQKRIRDDDAYTPDLECEGDFAPNRKPKYDKKMKAKKRKGHECPICFRMFKSGQALGGHKRSHFLNGSIDHYAAMEHEAPSCSDMIDLNLPAPEED